MIILTDVEEVYVNFGKPDQKALRRISISEIRPLYRAYEFPAGSMGPEVRAAIDFIDCGGPEVIISNARRLLDACEGKTGTHILPD